MRKKLKSYYANISVKSLSNSFIIFYKIKKVKMPVLMENIRYIISEHFDKMITPYTIVVHVCPKNFLMFLLYLELFKDIWVHLQKCTQFGVSDYHLHE